MPLQLWQGEHDLMVPPGHGRWLAERLPQAEWHHLPKAGHLTLPADQVPEIHRWLWSTSESAARPRPDPPRGPAGVTRLARSGGRPG